MQEQVLQEPCSLNGYSMISIGPFPATSLFATLSLTLELTLYEGIGSKPDLQIFSLDLFRRIL